MATLALPYFANASGAPYPISIYEPYRLQRNLQYIFIDNSSDFYAYLLADKLNPASFYMAYQYFQGKPLNKSQISDLDTLFKNNGNYIGNEPVWSESDNALESWRKERNSVMGDNYDYGRENNTDSGNYDNNIVLSSSICPFGTFENATKLLQDKKKSLNNSELKIWIKNQDQIFSNCFETWNSWSDRTWREPAPQITCDDNKLQELKSTGNTEKKSFWSRIVSFFTGNKKSNSEQAPKPAQQVTYYPKFLSGGSVELQRDEEMQNALYYFYKAKKENLCSNIASDLFKKISEDLDNPYHANATLGYIRSQSRDGKQLGIDEINAYLARKDLVDIKDALQVEKEVWLGRNYNEKEFLQSQKNLENPKSGFIHDAQIFLEQYQLLSNISGSLLSSEELAKHSELVRFLYYWNFDNQDTTYFSRIENEYTKSSLKNLWLALILKSKYGSKYIDVGLSVSSSSKLYHPVYYYTLKDLMEKDSGKALSLAKNLISQPMPDVAYNYFADLVMKNVGTLAEKIEYMTRKPNYLKFLDTLDYSYIRSNNLTLESLLNKAGWQDTKTGATYYYKFRNKAIETPLDDELLTFINFGMPIDMLYSDPIIKDRFKEQIFTRAFILDRKDIYMPLLGELSATDSLLLQANNAQNDTQRKFLISYAILKSLKNGEEDKYGISIHNDNFNYGDIYGGSNLDDWNMNCNYCTDDFVYDNDKDKTSNQQFSENQRTAMFNKLLSTKEVAINKAEKDMLSNESLVKIFGEPVLAYMKSNPKDARVPEALALLIQKMRRWHYRNSDGDWTQKIFQTLQYKYPNSSWAKNTPVYW